MPVVANPVTHEIQLEEVLAVVRKAYSREIAEALRAELAVVASLSYADISCCLTLILEGRSGAGKSALLEMLNPNEVNKEYLRREDKFTAAAFVSNASNVTKKNLKDVDLLPKLVHKVMLTKELASMFGSDDKALLYIFGTITAVLDGRGFKTATGVHGERGYEGDFRFNWIGATTPIPTRIHNIMAQFGCRLLFYECRFPEPTYEEVLAKMKDASSYAMYPECNRLVNDFVTQHFERNGVNSVHTTDIETPETIFRELYNCAQIMTMGRRAVIEEESAPSSEQTDVRYHASPPEVVFRPLEMFRGIAIGSALIAKREYLTVDDVAIVRHIAFSSIPAKRRALLRCLISAGGSLTSGEVMQRMGCSKPTALKWMRELAATELCVFHDNESGSNEADSITLEGDFRF